MRVARSTGAVSGLVIAVLGIWGGIIPFVGPYFNYSFGSNATWHYTDDRLWLSILPGAAALLGGILLMVAGTRIAGLLGGWLATVAGAWFVVGPAVSRTWEHATGPIGRPLYGNVRQMAELVGYFYGLGALIIALAAFAVGRFLSRPQPAALVGAPTTVAPTTTAVGEEGEAPESVIGGQTATGGGVPGEGTRPPNGYGGDRRSTPVARLRRIDPLGSVGKVGNSAAPP